MKYKVDVILVTYNQKNYIEKALDSILSQQFDSFRIIVHDDCSTDGTKEIIEKYQKEYPQLVFPIFETKRTFAKLGFNKMLRDRVAPYVESDYIAYCDGDDYWCDDKKLSILYNFLEQNRTYSMCFSSSYVLEPDGSTKSKHFLGKSQDLTINDILSDEDGIAIATSSIFLRSFIFKDFPEWRVEFPVEDFPLYILAAVNGSIKKFSTPMSVYRKFAAGSWSSSMTDFNKRINNLSLYKRGIVDFNIATSQKYNYLIEKLLKFYDFKLAYYKRDLYTLFLPDNSKYFLRLPIKERFSFFLQYKMPFIYKLLKK